VNSAPAVLVGVDGCKAGWIAVKRGAGETPSVDVLPSFAALLSSLPEDAIVVVDMPIGLPEFTGRGGRGPERLVRPLLGPRQSSVFSIPSRAAIYAATGEFTGIDAWYDAHRQASEVARRTSDPPRGVSIQAFGIFSKIREIDAFLIARPDLRASVFESHPEVAFSRLNGGRPMQLPKKIRGRINPDGMAERKALLCRHGYDMAFLDRQPPRGAAADDFLDAAVMMLIAGRIADGEARPAPNPPLSDGFGIPIAIWA
jgi:predicted RNase H-like nuclease